MKLMIKKIKRIYYSLFLNRLAKTYYIKDKRFYMQNESCSLINFDYKLEENTLWIRSYNINGTDFVDYIIRFEDVYLKHFKSLEKTLEELKK